MFFMFMSATQNSLLLLAAIAAADLDSKARCKLACVRVLVDRYAQGRVGRNSELF